MNPRARLVAVAGCLPGMLKSREIATKLKRPPESAAGDAPIVTAVADLPPDPWIFTFTQFNSQYIEHGWV